MTAFILKPHMQRWYRAALSGGPESSAAQALKDETDGLALSFTDDFFLSSTSHYGSARVKDTSTPANNYNSHPFGLLTYAGASKKWVRGPSGLYLLSDFANDLPFEWDEMATLLGIRVEEQRVSRALRSRRLDDATHWTASNITTSATEGIDGVTGSATRITATANNGTILGSSNTSASAARRLAPFVRRVAGTGNLEWTLDGGSTWTAFEEEITSSFKRIGVGATVANPRIGFRIASNGDSFDIDFANGEDGTFDTSPLESTDSHVTRAADNISLATEKFPVNLDEGTLFYEMAVITGSESTTSGGITLRSSSIGVYYNLAAGRYVCSDGSEVTVNSTFGVSTSFRKVAAVYAEDDFAYVIDGGTPVTDNSGGLAASLTRLDLHSTFNFGATNTGHNWIKRVLYLPRRMTNTELQTLTGA